MGGKGGGVQRKRSGSVHCRFQCRVERGQFLQYSPVQRGGDPVRIFAESSGGGSSEGAGAMTWEDFSGGYTRNHAHLTPLHSLDSKNQTDGGFKDKVTARKGNKEKAHVADKKNKGAKKCIFLQQKKQGNKGVCSELPFPLPRRVQ